MRLMQGCHPAPEARAFLKERRRATRDEAVNKAQEVL